MGDFIGITRQQPYADFFQKSFFSGVFRDAGQIYIQRQQIALSPL
jgi:hypothetical protein